MRSYKKQRKLKTPESTFRRIKRKIRNTFSIVGLIIIGLIMMLPEGLDISAKAYDFKTKQAPVKALPKIDAVLKGFEKIPFAKLKDKKYLEWSQFNETPFKKMAKGRHFYKIQGSDYNKFLVGNFRVRDFLPNDTKYYTNSILPGGITVQYLMIDARLLYKLAELQKELKNKNLDPEAMTLVSSFRYPRYNKSVGGASRSRHILGEAIDIRIGDINKDGKYTQNDKQIVYDLLDKKLIANQGGLGRYPGTRTIHFDVRGHRARWDTH